MVANWLTLRWGDYPGLSRQNQCNNKDSFTWKEAEEPELRKRCDHESKGQNDEVAGFEDKVRGR